MRDRVSHGALPAFALLAVLLVAVASVTPAFAASGAVSTFATQEAEHDEANEAQHGEESGPETPGEHGDGQEPEHAAADAHGDEGDHGDEEHAGPTWTEYIYKWINFVLLLGVLYWLLVAPPAFVRENFEYDGLKPILSTRASGILAARQLAVDQKQEAATRLAESAGRLEQVEQEAAALLVAAREDAAREQQRIEEQAREEAEQIRHLAHRDMNAEIGRSKRSLQAHVADLAVGIATDLLRKNFKDEDQDRLVREYLDRLGDSVA